MKEVKIGEKLREIRCKSGYTQQQIANILNCSRSTYTYYELGKTSPDVMTLVKLSKVFNISVAEFLEEEPAPYPLSDPAGVSFRFPHGKKNASHIYELSERELELVGVFRSVSPERQKAIIDYAKENANK